jgi:hypothetical protein
VVNRRRWAAATLLAACASGMAACTAVIPTPSAADPSVTPPAAGATITPAASSAPSGAPSPSFAEDDLRAEIEIVSIDPGMTHPLLEFVSDAESIVFSSARAEDAGPDGAPDLWRILPPDAEPQLVWRNPERNHSIVKIAGDLGLFAFVEMPLTGERAWNLWLVPRGEREAVLLDSHPGDEDVSSLVPSIAVHENTVVWTAFDRGAGGPVSQLRIAQASDWQPRTIHELAAAEAEVWLPSLRGATLAYMEVHYSADRSTDERHVYLTTTAPGAERVRLDASGRATMPIVVEDAVLWKEADPGFSIFNWGRMFRYDLGSGTVERLSTSPHHYVNYPSAGGRFAAWWGADSFRLAVYDLVRDETRLVAVNSVESDESEFRPHLAGDLLVWRHVRAFDADDRGELRYAFLPPVREP